MNTAITREEAIKLATDARELYLELYGRLPDLHDPDPILLHFALTREQTQRAGSVMADAVSAAAEKLPEQIAQTVSAEALQPIQAALAETARGPIQSIKKEACMVFWVNMCCVILCALVFLAFTYSNSPDELRKASVQAAEQLAQSAQGRAIAELTSSLDALRTEVRELRAERDQLRQFVERFVERRDLPCSEDADADTRRVCEAYRELHKDKEERPGDGWFQRAWRGLIKYFL